MVRAKRGRIYSTPLWSGQGPWRALYHMDPPSQQWRWARCREPGSRRLRVGVLWVRRKMGVAASPPPWQQAPAFWVNLCWFSTDPSSLSSVSPPDVGPACRRLVNVVRQCIVFPLAGPSLPLPTHRAPCSPSPLLSWPELLSPPPDNVLVYIKQW